MAVSEERIDELLEQMLTNADIDGWCYIPEGLSEEEDYELTKRLAIITMQDRIDTLMSGVLEALKYMDDIKKHVEVYDTMERLKIKGSLSMLKEDSQTLLIDLHSHDIINDFFRIDLVVGDNDNSEAEAEEARRLMNELIETDFKQSLEKMKTYCQTIVDISDELNDLLEENK